MMTGDNRKTAEAVAAEVGVDEFYAEVLPEDKANFIRREKEMGRTVIMVGDGVNDSPALSEASVGVAINTGAAIAREIADITVAAGDLYEVVTLRQLQHCAHGAHTATTVSSSGFNLMLIPLGVRRNHPADYLRTPAQYVHTRHQPQKHDRSSAGKSRGRVRKEASRNGGQKFSPAFFKRLPGT